MPNGESRDFDRPAERLEAFYRWLGTAPQVYSGALEASIRHANAAPVDASAQRWTPLGPRNVGGAVRSLAQDPRTPTTLYAGSAQGGLWKSVDDGYSWTALGGPELMLPIGALALSPSDPRVLYVGTGELAYGTVAGRGFYKSTDGGGSLEKLVGSAAAGGAGAADHYARIQVDPLDPDRCWVASDTGLWRFEGNSATGESLPGVAAGTRVNDVVLARDPTDANEYVLLAGVEATGIFRGVFNRRSGSTAWSAVAGAPAAGIGRIRLAFSQTKVGVAPLPFAYAIFEDQGLSGAAVLGFPTVVYQSTDFGRTWAPPVGAVSPAPPPAAGNPGQAWYSMALAVDPTNPNRVIAGYVNLHMSINGGGAWTTILDWTRYDQGDRAQHADQHTILFDVRPSAGGTPQLWACNDGGISATADLGAHWRKKSYGIVAAQFTDITTHPRYPFILGGGMQDNGTFVSYGGPTWYRLNGGDGGQMAFDPNDPRRFFTTWQSSVEFTQIIAAPPPPLPLNSVTLPDVDSPNNVMVPQTTALAFPAANGPVWVGVVESDAAVSNRLLLGRVGAGFYSVDGVNVAALNTPGANTPAFGDVSIVAFAQGAPDLWLGTTRGLVFTTPASPPAPPAVGPAWTATPLPAAAGGAAIAGIAIHPLNANVAAVSTWGTPGRVFLTHDKGTNWSDITGTTQALPPSPITSVAFDPASTEVLYAGTLAGVYVIRNLPPRGAGSGVVPAFTPTWRTYNLGLPAVQVNDLSIAPVTNTLRCATYGRGVYEVNLPGATPAQHRIPDVLLSIREHVADDGRSYPPANLFFDDPRLPPPAPPPPPLADFDHTRAIDIRVDAPSFIRSEAFAFGESIDGAEFDETLVSDKPLVGDTNFLYVQVQNRGAQPANNVKVYVYYADAGNPPVPPPLDAAMNYPGEPAPASTWQIAAPVETVGFVHPGQPAVVRFEWTPPLKIKDNVALLALCSNAEDSVAALPGGTAVVDFVKGERRAALRVVGVNRDAIYTRDGVDDDGSRGAVAWGGRSPDIIVVQTAVADPDDPAGPFKDLQDPRFGDRVHPGNNFIYVRVLNRTEVAVNANVRVFQVPTGNPVPGTSWIPVGGPAAVAAIPPKGWKFASIPWAGVTDPDPANPDYKVFTLVAVANVTDGAGIELDPFPDLATVTDLDNFWRFFLSAPLANNAAMRGLRFVAP